MEENQEKKTLNADESIFRGAENYENSSEDSSEANFSDFDDFPEEGDKMPELEKDLVEMEEKASNENMEASKKEEVAEEQPKEEIVEKAPEQPKEQIKEQAKEEISEWEEFDSKNSVVKKYIVYIAKEFIPTMDSLTTDERSAYINDAIQKKIDFEDVKKQKNKKFRLVLHFIIMIVVFVAVMPFALLGVNKAIMMTFENYKYSQDNFEKLYKQHFEKDRAYMRSLEYNKKQSKVK